MNQVALKLSPLFGVLLYFLTACSSPSAEVVETIFPTQTERVVVVTATPTETIPATSTRQATATPRATSTPRATATPIPTVCRSRTDWETYTVKQGDTLGKIAQATGSNVTVLATANCITNVNNVIAGQRIVVPRQPNTPTHTYTPSVTATLVPSMTATDIPYQTLSPVAPPLTETALQEIWLTQGSINISSYISADAGNYRLQAGETITLRWDNAPIQLLSATFYVVGSNGARTEIGKDIDPQDGLSISWTVPTILDGHQLLAEGVAPNAASFDYARSYSQTVYSVSST